MPVSFRILPSLGLVYVRYEGFADVADSMKVFGEYAQHPDCRPGQKQFVDLSLVTEVEQDFPKLMELQAQKAGVFMNSQAQTLIVYYVTDELTRAMASLIARSWEPFPWVIPVVYENEKDALEFLGLAATSISELLNPAN
ncbi:hypothetical protein [Aestuariibius sp. HNIBRBA575]|uniref:hypothetical protein n=1 Tax=Aestuariibius sp. HNIBRBA575 TaxID=3233343 RepID=UPI0034A2A982